MIKIRKDNVEKIVTIGAFEELYERMGYEIVDEPKNEKDTKPSTPVVPEQTEGDTPEVKDNEKYKGNK